MSTSLHAQLEILCNEWWPICPSTTLGCLLEQWLSSKPKQKVRATVGGPAKEFVMELSYRRRPAALSLCCMMKTKSETTSLPCYCNTETAGVITEEKHFAAMYNNSLLVIQPQYLLYHFLGQMGRVKSGRKIEPSEDFTLSPPVCTSHFGREFYQAKINIFKLFLCVLCACVLT
jgi:hypothetical protein